MKCFLCEKDNRPLIEAKHRFTKHYDYGDIDYDMICWLCLSCLGIQPVIE